MDHCFYLKRESRNEWLATTDATCKDCGKGRFSTTVGAASDEACTDCAAGRVEGRLRGRVDGPGRTLRFVERMANWRSRIFQLPYGDQAIFLKTETFHNSGGFADIPLMEDFELMGRLRNRGRIELAPGSVTTSARRWRKLGVWRATWTNQFCIMAHLLGVPCDRIARWRERIDHSP